MNTAPLPALSVGSVQIRQHGGLYSLNDLHKASGSDSKHQPSNFIRLDTTQALITELSNSSDVRNYQPAEISNSPDVANNNPNTKQEFLLYPANLQNYVPTDGGTYACKELVIAYASWISAGFHLKVIRVFLDSVANPAQALPPPVPTKTLTFTVPVNDHTSRWLLHTDRTGREVVTELSPETHVITADQWIHRLMVNPGDLNLTLSQILSITHACLNAMRTSTGLYASRLNIQPAEPPRVPQRQFASIGIPPSKNGERP